LARLLVVDDRIDVNDVRADFDCLSVLAGDVGRQRLLLLLFFFFVALFLSRAWDVCSSFRLTWAARVALARKAKAFVRRRRARRTGRKRILAATKNASSGVLSTVRPQVQLGLNRNIGCARKPGQAGWVIGRGLNV
jgi:hypothetical protein